MTDRDPQAGLTLTELTVVIVIAGILMTGLATFYLNSQSTWLEGSTQVIAQREVSMVLATISDRARRANAVSIQPSPDAAHAQITLGMPGSNPDSTYTFWWSATDQLIHVGIGTPKVDLGAMLSSTVESFYCSADSAMLRVDSLRVHTAQGDQVVMGTAVALQNRGAP